MCHNCFQTHLDEAFDRIDEEDLEYAGCKIEKSPLDIENELRWRERAKNKECVICGTKLVENKHNQFYCPNIECITGLTKELADTLNI